MKHFNAVMAQTSGTCLIEYVLFTANKTFRSLARSTIEK